MILNGMHSSLCYHVYVTDDLSVQFLLLFNSNNVTRPTVAQPGFSFGWGTTRLSFPPLPFPYPPFFPSSPSLLPFPIPVLPSPSRLPCPLTLPCPPLP